MSQFKMFNDVEGMKTVYGMLEQFALDGATKLVKFSGLDADDSAAPIAVFDNACGPGMVTQAIYGCLPAEKVTKLEISAGDLSPAMVDMANATFQAKSWPVKAQVADMQDLKTVGSASLDYILTNQGVSFAPDANKTLSEMYRVLKPGGTATFSTFKEGSWVDVMGAAIKTIPGCTPWPAQDEILLKTSLGNAWHHEGYVTGKLNEHGFTDISFSRDSTSFTLKPEEFVMGFCGAIAKQVCEILWGSEATVKFYPKLGEAVIKYCEAEGLKELSLTMGYCIYTAKRAK